MNDSAMVHIYPVDHTPPVTTITLNGISERGGTFITPVEIRLSATDGDGSGVNRIEYRFGTGVESADDLNDSDWISYPVPGSVTIEGRSDMSTTVTFYYRSVDNAGNAERPKTKSFTIKLADESGWQPVPSPAESGSSSGLPCA